jgi:hypothetical protein
VPDVRRRVGVVDGGGDVVRFHDLKMGEASCRRIVCGEQLRPSSRIKMKRRLGSEPADGAT